MKNPLMPKKGKHWIQSRSWEVSIGIILFLIGSMLLWDAFDNRGRQLPWAARAVTPW